MYQNTTGWKSLKGERIEWGRHMNGSKGWVIYEGKGKIGGVSSTYQSRLIMLMLKGELLCIWWNAVEAGTLQVWLAGGKGEAIRMDMHQRNQDRSGSGSESFSRTGYSIVSHGVAQDLQGRANHLLHSHAVFVYLECRDYPHVLCLCYHRAIFNIYLLGHNEVYYWFRYFI
jgi:hypothetical protein